MSALMSGCGFKDIDKRYFVLAIGIDEVPDKTMPYQVTVKIALPSPEAKKGASQSITMTEAGRTIADAVKRIRSKLDKKPDFSHTKIVLLGKSLAASDLRKHLDWFVRRRDIQFISNLAMAEPDAQTVLSIKPSSEHIAVGSLLFAFGGTGNDSSFTTSIYLFDFNKRLFERGLDPMLPVVDPTQDQRPQVHRTALFDKKGLKLTLTPDESQLFNVLDQKMHEVEMQFGTRQNSLQVVFSTKPSFRLKKENGGKVTITYRLEMEGTLDESQQEVTLDELRGYEQMIESQLTQRVMKLLLKMKKNRVDPLGFGLRYRAEQPGSGEWEQWQAAYERIEFEVLPNVHLQSPGAVQ